MERDDRAAYREEMCRSIRPLNNFEPPATTEEVRAAALQYVRKVAGITQRPSAANEAAVAEAVEQVAHATAHLIERMRTSAPPKNREDEAIKARARSAVRYGSVG